MNSLVVAFLTVAFLVVPRAVAQFEGEIDMKQSSFDPSGEKVIKYRLIVKDNLFSMSLTGAEKDAQKGRFIVRGDRNVFWIVDDGSKTYFEIPIDDAPPTGKGDLRQKGASKGRKLAPRKTGRSETLLGYQCDEYVIQEGEEETRFLGTTKFGNMFEHLKKSLSRSEESHEESGWEAAVASMNIFPLRVVTTRGGAALERTEVTRIEKMKTSAVTFEAPAGYAKLEMENALGKMMKGRKGKSTGGVNDPGVNAEMEKMLQQMQEKMKNMESDAPEKSDTSDEDDE